MRYRGASWALSTSAAALAVAASAASAMPIGGAGGPASRLAKPTIRDDHVGYGDRRRRQMAAYSERHYGDREWRLTDPKVIVLHFTATGSYRFVWSSFDSNASNRGERPGVCSHYAAASRGPLYELSRPDPLPSRDGLNHVAIGIEMVQETGTGRTRADQQILDRCPQIRAALALARWLEHRHSIPTAEAIGHSMADDDPYFEDLEVGPTTIRRAEARRARVPPPPRAPLSVAAATRRTRRLGRETSRSSEPCA